MEFTGDEQDEHGRRAERRVALINRWKAVGGVVTVVAAAVTAAAAAVGATPSIFSSEPDRNPASSGPPADQIALPSTTSSPLVTASPDVPTPPGQAVATLFDGEVRLESETGADLETGQRNGQIRGSRGGGISGSADIYIDSYGYLQVASDGFYSYPGLEKDAYKRCMEIINSGSGPVQGIHLTPGRQHCFATSGNHIAWTRVSASTLYSQSGERYVILRVKVWEQ